MAPSRVLREMRELGLDATELGPPGYLPENSEELRAMLSREGLQLAAGFLAVVLHERDGKEAVLAAVEKQAATLAAAGADVLVLAAAHPGGDYERHGSLSRQEFKVLAEALAAAEAMAARRGIRLALHPHAGTAVERAEDVTAFLETTNVDLCLDTGHLLLGGVDVVKLARDAGPRISHVHLKDVDEELVAPVLSGDMTYAAAVRAGLYRPLGQGGVDVKGVLDALGSQHYAGWYVLEQDTAIDAEPAPGDGPIRSARQSLEFFGAIHGGARKI
jgi:inosose dehydratase